MLVEPGLAPHRFDRMELAGSLGDLGTLIPLGLALIMVNGLHFTAVFGVIGLFYIGVGLYYRLPIPVQPLKVVSAIAIAYPQKVTPEIISASALVFSLLLAALAFSGIIERIARFFTKPIVRGIQLGLGMVLILKGISLIGSPQLLVGNHGLAPAWCGAPVNTILGVAGGLLALVLINSRKAPAALVLVGLGTLAGVIFGGAERLNLVWGPSKMDWFWPDWSAMTTSFWLLVLPQIPLTIGNAVISTTETARSLFKDEARTARVGNRSFCLSMSLANLAVSVAGGAPLCHGAGGLAAHYRFGARTGGSNLMIGALFLLVALVMGQAGLTLLGSIPQGVLGVLLVFAGLELGLLIRDVHDRADLFVSLFIAGLALATTNMSLAFLAGLVVNQLVRIFKIDLSAG